MALFPDEKRSWTAYFVDKGCVHTAAGGFVATAGSAFRVGISAMWPFVISVLCVEPRTSHVLGNCSTPELSPPLPAFTNTN